ncbi:MAG: hypothetical protein O7C59_11900 [Rickettsia endosymbiont of Ixodes persulcatus]|nr:hypothetical protein [Rickettsia endosymbiont of Ixodes persulcatus]MCZ6904017.1 hypothetical protein [Rickettsia endosymbiont of Ixodes persulcatus]MCZ6909053.1 hypothetical protein [Rickettsia endosymbiont of Ixodes persulcatus]MCZ6910925.1 hypothetical protein [Rickettsia endosymbiont of Ixodes persulcatus]MCZ6915052.1 hypothetical protein [Rickettsia endosymbiont of Ixodes persulcatus]
MPRAAAGNLDVAIIDNIVEAAVNAAARIGNLRPAAEREAARAARNARRNNVGVRKVCTSCSIKP